MPGEPTLTDDPEYFPSTDYERGYADGRLAALPPVAPDSRVGPDEGLRAAVQKAIDEHLGRMASSEPFTAAQYRRHGIDALDILRAALVGSAE